MVNGSWLMADAGKETGYRRSYSHSSHSRIPRSRLSLVALLLLAATCALAQTPITTTYTWPGTDLQGWTHSSAYTFLSNPGGRLNIRFYAQEQPYAVTDLAWVDTPTNHVITEMSFRFRAQDIRPSAVRLYIRSKVSGNLWYINLGKPPKGEWTTFIVPVKHSEGWITPEGNTEAQFLLDMESVDWVGVYVRRHGTPKVQNYSIDDFTITAYEINYVRDTDGDGMPDGWEMDNDLDLDDPSDAGLDPDGDGATNLEEYRAGTDPNSKRSAFVVEIEVQRWKNEVFGAMLRWPSALGRTYSVWRGTNMVEAGLTNLASGVPGTPPKNLFNDDTATNNVPYFYRVTVEP